MLDTIERWLTNIQLAAAAEKATEDSTGISLATSLLLVDLACLAVVLAARRALLGGDEGHGGNDGDDAGELHFG